MSPEERRASILAAAKPVLLAHGRDTTTKMIAEAAGIAEGTIFRVFDSKDDLVRAVLAQTFDPEPFLDAVGTIDLDQPLETRLLEATRMLQQRFQEIFRLMTSLAVPGPPPDVKNPRLKKRVRTELDGTYPLHTPGECCTGASSGGGVADAGSVMPGGVMDHFIWSADGCEEARMGSCWEAWKQGRPTCPPAPPARLCSPFAPALPPGPIPTLCPHQVAVAVDHILR